MLTFIQLSIFLIYVTYIVIKFGVLSSISDSWYVLEANKRNSGVLFTFFCWSLGFLMFFQTTGETGLFFLSGAGICFTGAATMFKTTDAHTKQIHFGGAIACIIGALIGLYIEYHLLIPILLFVVGTILTYIFVKRNTIWWIEIISFASIGLGLICK